MRSVGRGGLSALVAMGLLLLATIPAWCGTGDLPTEVDHIGLYASPDATGCELSLGAGESLTVEVLVVLPTLGAGGLTALEFRVAGLPENGDGGSYTAEWDTELVIGRVDTGIAMAFSDPLYGEIIPVGRLTFHALTDDWLGANHALRVVETEDSHKLVIVNDVYAELFVPGARFTFNCDDPGGCPCGELYYPGCLLVPPTLDFGFVWLGDGADRNFRLFNYTAGPLHGDISESCEHYTLLAGEGPYDLGPGQSRLVRVRYEPFGVGEHVCSIDLGSEPCADLPCTGYSQPPATHCELSVDHLDFGEVEVGTHVDRSFTITNVGDAFLLATITENCPAYSLYSGGGTVWLDPGQTHTVTVRFSPTGLGPQACQIETGVAGENDCGPVTCAGTGVPNPIDCALTPALLDFGGVAHGEQVDRPFTIENLDDQPLSVQVAISGQGFSIVQGGGHSVIAPGQVLQGIVRFDYVCPGEFTGTLTTGHPECPSIPCVATCLPRNPRSWATICVFSEQNGYTCYEDIEPYTWTTVYIVATVSADVAGIEGAEFRLENLPPANCVTLDGYWAADHASGNLSEGVTLTFDEPQPGPRILLAVLEFYQTDPDCIGSDYEMVIAESWTSGHLRVIDDCGDSIGAAGGHFTFNCWGWCDCFWATPVTVTNFELEDRGAAARVRWACAEAGDAEFRLEAALGDLSWVVPYTHVAGSYEALDTSPALAAGGEVTYSLYGRAGAEEWTPLRSETLTVSPARLETRLLSPNPNPFNPAVTIPFSLAEAGSLRLAIYDIAGRRVALLVDGPGARGEQAVIWRGRDDAGRALPSGVYFVGMEARGFSARQKLVLLR